MKRSPLKPGATTMKRSPMSRVGILAQSSADRLKKPRPRRCAVKTCRARFMPAQPFITWCSLECGAVLALDKLAKKKEAAARADRVETKRKLAKFKTIPTLKAEAQRVFNEYVRLRDELAGHGCICCGKFPTAAALAQLGGAWDACHFRSRGSADHLRFDERNVHRGLKDCNGWGHKDYRGGLIARIGREAVEALECDQTVVKWTREYLEGLKTEYRAKLRALKATNGGCDGR